MYLVWGNCFDWTKLPTCTFMNYDGICKYIRDGPEVLRLGALGS